LKSPKHISDKQSEKIEPSPSLLV